MIDDSIVTLCVCERDDAVVVTVRGELDASTRKVVHEGLAVAAVDSCARVVVDASEITFIDCAGWDGVVAAATETGHEVWVRSPSWPVRRLLELLQLDCGERLNGLSDEVRIA